MDFPKTMKVILERLEKENEELREQVKMLEEDMKELMSELNRLNSGF